MKGRRGHFCWVCGRVRSNESFSGKGHARNQCRDCCKMPAEELQARRALDFLDNVLFRQRNISRGNMRTLTGYLDSPRAEVRERAQLLLEVARVKPHKRKRYGYLRHHHPELLVRLNRLFGWPVDLPYDDDLMEEEEFDEVPFPCDEDYPGEEVGCGLLELTGITEERTNDVSDSTRRMLSVYGVYSF